MPQENPESNQLIYLGVICLGIAAISLPTIGQILLGLLMAAGLYITYWRSNHNGKE